MSIGTKHSAITKGRIGPLGGEAVGFLNGSSQEAHVQISVYYSNRDPVGPYRLTVPAGRLRRVRFSGLKDPEPIERAIDYTSTIESHVPIVVHPELASLQPDPVSHENKDL